MEGEFLLVCGGLGVISINFVRVHTFSIYIRLSVAFHCLPLFGLHKPILHVVWQCTLACTHVPCTCGSYVFM